MVEAHGRVMYPNVLLLRQQHRPSIFGTEYVTLDQRSVLDECSILVARLHLFGHIAAPGGGTASLQQQDTHANHWFVEVCRRTDWIGWMGVW
jgi:hypothetical protein